MRSQMRPATHGPAARRLVSQRPGDVVVPWRLRLGDATAPATPTAAEPLARDAALARLEAALLAADEPLAARKLAAVAELPDAAAARRLVQRLRELYDADSTAFQVEELAGGYQLLTRPEYHRWLARLRQRGQEQRLSAAVRETLAIIAYRQPITPPTWRRCAASTVVRCCNC